MITLATEQAQQIEESLSGWKEYDAWTDQQMWNNDDEKALVTIREARAQEQAEQEPIGEVDPYMDFLRINWKDDKHPPRGTKLYAAPVRTKDLTDEDFVQSEVKSLRQQVAALKAVLDAWNNVEQEPVAWRVRGYNQFKTGNPAPWRYVDGADKPTVNKPDCCDFEPLYAAPVRTKDLTDDEIKKLQHKIDWTAEWSYVSFARAVIAKFKEKNK